MTRRVEVGVHLKQLTESGQLSGHTTSGYGAIFPGPAVSDRNRRETA